MIQEQDILARIFDNCPTCQELASELCPTNGHCTKDLQARAEQCARERLEEHLRYGHARRATSSNLVIARTHGKLSGVTDFSPSPWKIDPRFPTHVVDAGQTPFTVADCGQAYNFLCQANARLVRAAPELLTVLSKLLHERSPDVELAAHNLIETIRGT